MPKINLAFVILFLIIFPTITSKQPSLITFYVQQNYLMFDAKFQYYRCIKVYWKVLNKIFMLLISL